MASVHVLFWSQHSVASCEVNIAYNQIYWIIRPSTSVDEVQYMYIQGVRTVRFLKQDRPGPVLHR